MVPGAPLPPRKALHPVFEAVEQELGRMVQDLGLALERQLAESGIVGAVPKPQISASVPPFELWLDEEAPSPG